MNPVMRLARRDHDRGNSLYCKRNGDTEAPFHRAKRPADTTGLALRPAAHAKHMETTRMT